MSDRTVSLFVTGLFIVGSLCFLIGNVLLFVRAWSAR